MPALPSAEGAAAGASAALTADDLSVGCIFEMAVDNLLSEGEGAAKALANDGDVLVEPLVVD